MTKPILATDLDGTLIPPEGSPTNSPEHQALMRLKDGNRKGELEIVFVTGRHFQSVAKVMRERQLPDPAWIICDVGSSLYLREETGYQRVSDYVNHLNDLTGYFAVGRLRDALKPINHMVLQEPEKQGNHKLSFYCDPERLQGQVERIQDALIDAEAPYGVVSSLDPFTGTGLIDVLPRGVNKAYALGWWSQWQRLDPARIVFAGDSGNDAAALLAGYRGILVGNASSDLRSQLRAHHEATGSIDRLYAAKAGYTAGVLEGCRHFGIVSAD